MSRTATVALAGVDGLEPCRAVAACDAGQQLFQHFAQIADQGHIDLDVLVDLGRVHFDVNLFGLGGIGGKAAGDAIVEAHAAGDEQIGFLNGVVDPRLAVHAHHAQVERVRGGKRAQAEQRESHGNLRALGKGADLLHGAGFRDAVAGENDGALGVADQFGGLREAAVFYVQHRMRTVRLRLGGFKVEDRRGLLRVLGDVDEHRAGSAGLGDLKGLAQRRRQVLSAVDEEVVLGDGQRDAGDVDFLERIGAQHLAGDVAGNADHGNRIEHGGGNAGDEIGCAGAAGRDATPTLPEARA